MEQELTLNLDDLNDDYRAMAEDEEREAQAFEWIEALIGDAAEDA